MSVQITKAVLQDFLTNNQNDVLALTGAWGTGKTYAWREALMAHKESIKFKHYCYVSLFGINTMAELRMALFVKSMDVATLGKNIDFDAINEHWVPLARDWLKGQYARFGAVLKSLPHGSSVSLGLEALAPSAVRNTLVCLDDFERQTAIKAEDVLGLITELKEERCCKVALIFNVEKLEAKDVYRAYKEKAVDYEVLYAPTVEEAFDLVFDASYPNRKDVFQRVVELGITNVRILRKLHSILARIRAATAGLHALVLDQSIATAVLLCWCAYTADADKPRIDEISTWNKKLMSFKNEKETEDPAWVRRLKTYGFIHVDDMDLAIARMVENGYVEGTGFPELAKKLDAECRAKEKIDGLSEIWNRFHDTFCDDPDDFVKQLHAYARAGIEHIGTGDLNSAVTLFRQLNRDDLADDLIGTYINSHRDKPSMFDLAEHPFGGTIDDPGLRKAFEDAYSDLRRLPSLEESISFMVEHSGYNNEHIEALKTASVEDYYRLFTQPHTGRRLSQFVKWSLRFNSGDQAEIGEKARKALEQIKESNLLNKIRVRKYGI